MAQPTGNVCPAKKAWWSFSPPPLFFFNKQKIEDQPESNSVTIWTPNPWKSSLHPTTLNPVAVSVCIDKTDIQPI
jgi:hypothetical protein